MEESLHDEKSGEFWKKLLKQLARISRDIMNTVCSIYYELLYEVLPPPPDVQISCQED